MFAIWIMLIKGFFTGMVVAAPIGPTGLIWLKRMLTGGRRYGFFSGLGSAMADMLYAFIAVFGASYVADFILTNRTSIKMLSGILFIIIGLYTFYSRHQRYYKKVASQDPLQDLSSCGFATPFFSAFLLTLINPFIIFMFAGMMVFLGVNQSSFTSSHLLTFVVGVALGSASLWAIFAAIHWRFHHHLDDSAISWINKGTGILLLLFGVGAIIYPLVCS